MTGVALLGSTGSIGRQTLEVVAAHPERFEIRGLASGRGHGPFEEQAASHPEARLWSADGRPAGVDPQRWAGGGLKELA
ncbi:MAG TPA: hypothetical protein VK838_03895, partial [Candidatus Limnocylindrales bacterium]|nr:hypothetical protein [Candidatus Limnocylindrales bacterium]